jgi:6-phosphogluconolactonase (cycloisomerase 2 family)
MTRHLVLTALLAASAPALGHAADPQFLISANDNKTILIDGVQTVLPAAPPDTVSIYDVSVTPPKLIAELNVPASVVGPPQMVAIAPDRSIALVTNALKYDPADRTKTIPDDLVTVIDLGASPPKVAATLHAGRQASGVSINRAGTMALVANRADGTVSIFTIAGKTVTPAGSVDLGAPESGPSHVAFTPDGTRALVTRYNDNLISLLAIDNGHVTYTKRDIASGLKPYGVEITPAGDVAVAGNTGAGATGSVDTITVIDLKADPPRASNQLAAGPTVEGISLAPDGKFVATTVMNGTNVPKSSPFFHDFGLLKIFSLSGTTLAPVTSAQIGHWCQGAAWAPDGRKLFVQCMVEKQILMFDFDGRTLKPAGAVKVNGGPAAIRISR